MSRRRRLVALAAPVALLLGACATNDASRGDVVDAMTDAGLGQDKADCIGRQFDDEFDQDQLNEIGAADEPEDYPEDLRDEIDQILEDCIRGDGADTTTTEATEDTEGGDTEGGDTTEDTPAEG